jgi:hypothetical protein
MTLMIASSNRNSVLLPLSHLLSVEVLLELEKSVVSVLRAIANKTTVAKIIKKMMRVMIFLSIE